MFFRNVLALLVITITISSIKAQISRSINTLTECENSDMYLQCPTGGIYIESVFFGRSTLFICINDNECRMAGFPSCNGRLGNTSCVANRAQSLLKVLNICNGLKTCTFKNDPSVFGDPCPGTFKYGIVKWSCRSSLRQTVTVCENQIGSISCPGGLIGITNVFYGRRDLTTCRYCNDPACSIIKNTACSADPAICKRAIEGYCRMVTSCRFSITNYLFGDPCWGTYKYAEITYYCFY